MKLLIVFVSALVLVAYGNDTPSDEEGSVYVVDSVAAGYAAVAGQEAGVPKAAAEEAQAVGVFGADAEPRVASLQEPAAENVPAPESGVYIPAVARVCTNSWCVNICNQLGYRKGVCISSDTCYCYN